MHRVERRASVLTRSPEPCTPGLTLTLTLTLTKAWLDTEGCVALEVEARQGLVSRVLREPPPRALLRLTPTEVACACARGTRVALCSASSVQEACATVVGLDGQGNAIVSVDNATSLRAFAAWSAAFFGKASRGALHGVRIAPRPATMLAAAAPRHPPGTRLLVLRDGALLDMSVTECLGAAHGSLTLTP